MNTNYYFHERIAIECQRLSDLQRELEEQFNDPDISTSINHNVQLMSEHIKKAILRLRFAEQYGYEMSI